MDAAGREGVIHCVAPLGKGTTIAYEVRLVANPFPARCVHQSYLVGVLVTLLSIFCAQTASAEIFKYRDAQGVFHFTDTPRGSSTLIWRSGSNRAEDGFTLAEMKRNRSRFAPLINRVAKQTSMHPALLHAVIRAESAYNPKAVSSAGAVGLMQLMPTTAAKLGVKDSTNPFENIRAGSLYLKRQLDNFQDLSLALAAYNAGENAVRKYGNTIPPYPETQQYVRKVLTFYKQNSDRKIF